MIKKNGFNVIIVKDGNIYNVRKKKENIVMLKN